MPRYRYGTGAGDFISLVQLGNINNQTGASSSPYYTYYSGLSTDIRQGNLYTITLSAGTYSSRNNISVWIDFNQDGDFSDTEKLGNVTPGSMPETASITFSVPCDALVGITRMRVREAWNTSNMDPCARYNYGETEDYNINILASTLNLSLSSTTTCLGSPSGTGTITAIGNDGVPPYIYSLNSGTYQSAGFFTGLGAASYDVTVMDALGCTETQSITVTNPPTSGDDQNMTATNSWVGHVYDGNNFDNYVGHYTEPELFDQSFGGNTTCFEFTSAGQTHSIYTETYSVRYRMHSNRVGLWVVDLGSDDGSRMWVDNTLIYNNWTPQGFTTRSRVLISLSGNSNLVYEFFENYAGNRVVFKNAAKILDNILTSNLNQNLCLGGSGSLIGGDVLGSLPWGISLSGTGYQWAYSTTPGGAQIQIPGATGATFTPNTAVAPFNSAGTYYVYRKVNLSSSNNISPNPYIASNTSNAAIITINPALPASVSIVASQNPVCTGTSVTFTATPVNGGTNPSYQWKINGSNVGINSPTYTSSALTNGQSVSCVMTSNAPCVSGNPATSNAIVMVVGQEIGNNILNLSNGIYGTICSTVNEHQTATLTAPASSVFVHVAFASYGTPNGSCNNFTFGACHATTSFPVTENYLLGNNSASIPASNGVFGDPCVGTFKRYYVQAVYAEPICAGTSPGQITGTLPTGGNGSFTYLWESSITSATAGFTAAAGINSQRNYTPGNLNQTTWFRRTAYSGGCESTSRVMVIYVTPAISNNSISAPQTIYSGETPARLNGSTPSGGIGGYTYLWERSITNATSGFSACSGTNNSINYSPPALSQTTWFRRTVNSGYCTNVSIAVKITVIPSAHLWKGSLSTDFGTAGNWINNSVPAPGDNIEFDPAPIRHCVLDGPRTVGDITNTQSAFRLVANGHTFTINGDLRFANGAQIEAGSESSTLNFAGSTSQTIPAGAIFNNEVFNLIINNAVNVELQEILNIKGYLLVTKGVLNTNNNLTLLSTNERTALIDGSGMGQVSGDVTMQRYLPKGFGYKYLSSPMQNATVAELGDDMDLTASFPTFYTYDESKTSTGWNSYINPASPLIPLVGYCVNFGTNTAPAMADITGEVNNGTIGPLSVFNHDRQFTRGFNLVGNPYPSPVDWSKENGWYKTNIDNAVYYFNAGDTNQYTGTYSSYINGISSDGIASNIIPSMQGFFVHVSDGAYPVSGTLQINNQARVNNLSPAFHKNAAWDSHPLIRLNAKFEGRQSKEDFLAIYFDPFATSQFEMELDALKIFNTDMNVPNLFAISEDERRLSIGAWPQPHETLEIPLGIKTEKSGTVALHLDLQESMPTGYNVYLKDKATGAVQDLGRVPVYSLPIGNGLMEGRLSLIFSSSDISQGSFGNNSFNVYAQDGWLFVNIKLKEVQANLRLTNMAGQVLLQQNIYGEGSHRLSSAPPPGVYLVTVYTDQGILSKKIVLQ